MQMALRDRVYRFCLFFSRRRTEGIPFVFKCIAVACIFLFLEGAFVVHRWISTSKLTTVDLEELIPLEEGDYKVNIVYP